MLRNIFVANTGPCRLAEDCQKWREFVAVLHDAARFLLEGDCFINHGWMDGCENPLHKSVTVISACRFQVIRLIKSSHQVVCVVYTTETWTVTKKTESIIETLGM